MFKAFGDRKANKQYKVFESWLDDTLSGQLIPDEVIALNFNVYDGADDTLDIELIGAPGFDERDDDWACEEVYASDLLPLPLAGDAQSWEEGVADITGLVERYLETGQHSQWLKAFAAIGVGHVNGAIELVYLGEAPVPRENDFEELEGMGQPLELLPDGLDEQELPPPPPEHIQRMQQNLHNLFEDPVEAVLEEVRPLMQSRQAQLPLEQPPVVEAPVLPPPEPLAEEADSGPVQCFKLVRDIRPRTIFCTPAQDYGIRQYELLRGVPFARDMSAVTFLFEAEKGDIPTDLLSNSLGWLVVSERLRALLEELEPQIEYFPVEVREAVSGQTVPGYSIANLLRKEDALCLEESEYSVINHAVFGAYESIKKYAVHQQAIQDAAIFKLTNRQEIPVFVTGRFKRRAEQAGLTGMAFYPVKVV